MKLHEYQSKDLFGRYGIPIPKGQLVKSAEEAQIEQLKGPPWVVKAQIHAGGRGKGGGVKVVQSKDAVQKAVQSILSNPLVTHQTGPEGTRVHQVLIEEGVEIERELYLGIVVDRSLARPVVIFSPAGGMEIEEVARETPHLVMKEPVDPAVGWMPYQGRRLAFKLEPPPKGQTLKALLSTMRGLYNLFKALDCTLAEINPLVITTSGDVLAIDAKISIDDNALYRQKEAAQLDDPKEKDPLELKAQDYNLNYIRLDGNIGAMVNGAGLAMATMDVIKLAGAEPANFLDVGGGASEEMITRGFEIILEDKKVKAILINIFGGILRCDVLARGVLAAAEKTDVRVPLIVRLEGTNVEEGRRILEESGLKFQVAGTISEAASMVADQVRKR